jgi:site-specific DNA-methyltransferase (adenine-specific)
MEKNIIYNEDCLIGLKKLEAKSVDAIITDPPYGIDFQSARRIESERFDKIESDDKPFIWWLYDAYRVLKDTGCLICFCRWDVQDAFKQAIEWAGFKVKSQVIWDRQIHGLGDLNGQFAPRHDVIWFATKGDFAFKNGRPQSVISIQRVNAEKLIHPTEKPVSLLRHLVEKVSSEGNVILDPFVGGGSTMIACSQINRQYIGFEIDKGYYETALSRLKQKTLQGVLTQ